MTTQIADWSMYQSRFIGDPNSLADLFNPAKWIVDIDFSAVAKSVSGVILRVGIGTRKDPCFDRYLAGLKAAGIPWGIYHAYDPSVDAVHQAQLVRQWCPEDPPLGVWGDIEMGIAIAAVTMVYLAGLDGQFGAQAGVYSGGPYLDAHFTAAQQADLSSRLLWIAGYPNYFPPYGWAKGVNHALHQYTDSYQLAGVPKACDMSVPGPAWPYGSASMPLLTITGCYFGGHAQATSSLVPINKDLAAQGAPMPLILADENPGLNVDTAALGTTARIARFHHPETGPDHDFEAGGDGRENWPPDKRLRFARASIALPFDHMNPTEGANTTHVQCSGNEWEEQTVDGWIASLDTLAGVMDERDNRQAEYIKKYGRPLCLGLHVYNAGSPHTWAMYEAIAGHPIWRRAQRAGDLLLCHEGIAFNQPFTQGEGQPIDPAAPLLPGAGQVNFRIDYLLYLLWEQGIRINYAATEWYDGRAPRTYAIEARIDNMIVHDQKLAHAGGPWRAYCLGYCTFELTDDPNSQWYPQDFTLIWRHPRWQAYVVSQKGRNNGGTRMPDVPQDTLSQLAANAHSAAAIAQADLALLAPYQPAHTWAVGDVALANTNPLVTYVAPNGAVKDRRPPTPPGGPMITYDLDVIAVTADQLWLEVANNLWVHAADVKPKV